MTLDRRMRAFTLIELLAVIAIIGILAAFTAVTISGALAKARDAQRENDLDSVKKALALYSDDNGGSYPGGGGGFSASAPGVLSSLTPSYIKAIPSDPKDPTLQYQYKTSVSSGTPASSFLLYAQLENKNSQTVTNLNGIKCLDPSVPGDGVCSPDATPTNNSIKYFRVSND